MVGCSHARRLWLPGFPMTLKNAREARGFRGQLLRSCGTTDAAGRPCPIVRRNLALRQMEVDKLGKRGWKLAECQRGERDNFAVGPAQRTPVFVKVQLRSLSFRRSVRLWSWATIRSDSSLTIPLSIHNH